LVQRLHLHPDVEIPKHMGDGVTQFDVPLRQDNGDFNLALLDAQDVMAWSRKDCCQARVGELGTTDRGVICFAKCSTARSNASRPARSDGRHP